ncbi:MAG: hypothetical protein NT018_08165 [Armatimonadetes bacterium]|nr:hypothetical protein [Armatimonadota bacterium]
MWAIVIVFVLLFLFGGSMAYSIWSWAKAEEEREKLDKLAETHPEAQVVLQRYKSHFLWTIGVGCFGKLVMLSCIVVILASGHCPLALFLSGLAIVVASRIGMRLVMKSRYQFLRQVGVNE